MAWHETEKKYGGPLCYREKGAISDNLSKEKKLETGAWLLKNEPGGMGEMAQWANSLPHKCKDVSSDSPNWHVKARHGGPGL